MNPYLELKTKSLCTNFLLDLIPNLEFKLVYGNNMVGILDPAYLESDTGIHKVIKHFGCDVSRKISIFKFPPNVSYYWHTDGIRSCAINMVLAGFDSMTLFGKPQGSFFVDIEKIPYKPDTYVLLNTNRHHSVYNFSEVRYLLSIGIEKTYTFEDVKNYILENNI